ncbi:hypothetical protein FDI21_gp045 [Pseudomonas phage Noxifer]|uniref:Uncharacterized protein n=1 Tax=Pseudomonas phage Noxifer TaxID=2006684 RepID=A0A1Y0SZV9_9CAUD|nr:hypothetical protein FDI21_gp045 [Pseudomonas phage Noxifer]ARV77216.1 hypothetical protein NOXIFER_45 [Pseudomonas phage Noxifer]
MLIQMPAAQENGLIELRVTEFEQLLKPLFEYMVSPLDSRSYLITDHPPRMEMGEEWFGQGVYRRRGWNSRYAVIELDDHFLIVPEGEVDKIWRQEKLGVKRFGTWMAGSMRFMGRDLIDGLTKLNTKYARS